MTLQSFLTLISFLALSLSVSAHREHKSHTHGEAQVSLAFDGNIGQLDFEAPAEALIGFEYQPKTEQDKTHQREVLLLLETKISSMVIFAPEAKCRIQKESIEAKYKGKHGDVEGRFKITCDQLSDGSKLTMSFQQTFPRLKVVHVQLMAKNIQKSLRVTSDNTVIELKGP